MSINYLQSIFREAERFTENSGNWNNVEQSLNTKLPDDYKKFTDTFGSVYIDEFIGVLNPFSSNPNLDLVAQAKIILDDYRWLHEQGNEEPKYPYFPEKGGLLPFGTTDNGDVLFWKTAGQPNEWTVVVNAAREAEYDEFDENMTNFLSNILQGKLISTVFPNGFPSQSPTIEPIKS